MRLIIEMRSVRFSVLQGAAGTTCLLQTEVKGNKYDSTDAEFGGIFFGAIYSLTVPRNYCNVTTRHDSLL